MTHEEYEERKRRLDEQLEAGIELLKTAHRQQLRALDLVWMTTADGDVTMPRLPPPALPVRPPAAAASPAPAAVKSPPPPHRTAGQLTVDIRKVLSTLPESFDRNDVRQALGQETDRGSLYRALQNLVDEKVIATERFGQGRVPTRYKKLEGGSSAAAP